MHCMHHTSCSHSKHQQLPAVHLALHCIVCTTHLAAIVNISSFQQYITTQRPPQPHHRPSAAWASTTFPLAARSEFLLRAHHALGLASRVGLAPPMLSPSAVCVCALLLLEISGRLLGCTGCHHAPNQWTPGLTEHPTNSRSQQFHHVVMHLCTIRAAPPWVCLAAPCTS